MEKEVRERLEFLYDFALERVEEHEVFINRLSATSFILWVLYDDDRENDIGKAIRFGSIKQDEMLEEFKDEIPAIKSGFHLKLVVRPLKVLRVKGEQKLKLEVIFFEWENCFHYPMTREIMKKEIKIRLHKAPMGRPWT